MNTGHSSISVDFLDHPERKLFHLLLRPGELEPRGSVLFLHPFAEEMHKSRRIVASQARNLAAAGYNVMLLDLSGCGDGWGTFADASWSLWLEDACFALDALAAVSDAPLSVWGLRLGGLLACEVSRQRPHVQQLLLWQPVLNGEQQIDQFLRLRAAAEAIDSGAPFDRKSLWQELRSGRSLEVAGYELSSTMALEIAQVRLNDCVPPCQVAWAEIGNAVSGELSPASRNVISHWEERGVEVTSRYVPGEPFWRYHDARINTQLQQTTRELLL